MFINNFQQTNTKKSCWKSTTCNNYKKII